MSVRNPNHYVPMELSWLAFNERVLQEAADSRNPVVERVRFLGIFSSNQDEFFKVRVAAVRRTIKFAKGKNSRDEARKLLAQIQRKIMHLSRQFDAVYSEVMEELNRRKIFFISSNDLSVKQSEWLRTHFQEKILRHIVPIWVTDEVDLEEKLVADTPYFVAKIVTGIKSRFALVDVPAVVPRFVNIPPDRGHARNYFMLLDEVIQHNLDQIFGPFVDYDSVAVWSMKFSRDSSYQLQTGVEQSLIEKMSHGMKQRLTAEPVRFSYDKKMPEDMVVLFCEKLGIEDGDSVIPGGRYRNFKDFIGFDCPGSKRFEFSKMPAIHCNRFDRHRNVFEAIDEGDIMLAYPYHRFSYFTEFVRQAASDPAVEDIKINIYRVASHSRVIESLIDAAHNGKRVTVNVELQARFDEERNLEMTELLSESGIKVTLGIPGLKIHSKLCVVTRKVGNSRKRYAVIATGNFNESTAKSYTDFALFTCHKEICRESESVFQFIEHSYQHPKLKHLWVSPLNTRKNIVHRIQREIEHVENGGKGLIKIKLNNLVDTELSELLYAASQAGVEIKLVVRGMCGLIPEKTKLSENISVISIVDRFLEHSRLMVFNNMGETEVFISSADWMSRNLDDRVEVSCPIYDEKIKKTLIDLLDIQISDNQKARVIDTRQKNEYVQRGNRRKIRSQEQIYDYLIARDL